MITDLERFVRDEEGVDAIEYGLLAALIFLVIVAAVGAAASEAVNLFNVIAGNMSSAP